MKCEKCGNLIEDKYIWCPVCGTKKPKSKVIQVDDNVSLDRVDDNFCKKCGKAVTLDSKFCENCGSKLIDNISNNIVYCKCGQKIEPGWKFCPNCQSQIDVLKEDKNKDKNLYIYILLYFIFGGIYVYGSSVPNIWPFRSLSFLALLVTIKLLI